MKAALLGGALAFALWGGPALAGGDEKMTKNCPPGSDQSSFGTGGSADEGSEVSADCPDTLTDDTAMGGAGTDPALNEPYTPTNQDAWAEEPQTETNIVSVEPMEYEEEEKKAGDDRGVTVLLGGGVEGYTGDLAPQLNPGPQWGVGVALKPIGAVGLELGYSGAINSVSGSSGLAQDPDDVQDVSDEADIVRNGGSAIATLGLSSAGFQPYLLGGIGIDWYNARNTASGTFEDDVVGSVPVGLGFRTHIGNFTADLRGTYGILFNQGFAPAEGNTSLSDIGEETPTGRFGGMLRLGATF